ncbi:MAG: SMI1/KNR4 family protein [Planctomycetota bacterium]
MHDWRTIINTHHDKVHVQPGDKLLIRNAATNADLDELQDELGFQLPDEFRSLYLQCDGFGLTYEDNDQKWWFCHPIEQIPEFVNQTRKWFEETHPEPAARFFPFIDWANGDGMGYVLDGDGQVIDGLYCFEHENYEFEEDQELEEFVVKWNNTILELLSDGAGVVG